MGCCIKHTPRYGDRRLIYCFGNESRHAIQEQKLAKPSAVSACLRHQQASNVVRSSVVLGPRAYEAYVTGKGSKSIGAACSGGPDRWNGRNGWLTRPENVRLRQNVRRSSYTARLRPSKHPTSGRRRYCRGVMIGDVLSGILFGHFWFEARRNSGRCWRPSTSSVSISTPRPPRFPRIQSRPSVPARRTEVLIRSADVPWKVVLRAGFGQLNRQN